MTPSMQNNLCADSSGERMRCVALVLCAIMGLMGAVVANDAGACGAPTPLSDTGPNIMMIGDSISMGSSGYSLFVRDMIENYTAGTLGGSVQHGGGFGGGGQMASSNNGATKVTDCIGNMSGTLKPKAWSVITYNAGLHDCDTKEFVNATQYAINLKATFETLKPAASAVIFVTSTPWDMALVNKSEPRPAGINMTCVLHYNEIAKTIAQDVGGILVDDLYQYVEDFCHIFPKDGPGPYDGNYTTCAIQTTGLHFFNVAPFPSGQQYTGISIAKNVIDNIPEAEINNQTNVTDDFGADVSKYPTILGDCGDAPDPLNMSLPNVLVIGDSISEPGSGYGPGLEAIFEMPGVPFRNQSGTIAKVQHNGANGSNQAGPSTNGAACIKSWVGDGDWDVITINFGIHDCCPGGDGRPTGKNVPLPEYLTNLETIYDTASKSLAPNGSIVWVTTTPTPFMDGYNACGLTGSQFNDCIDEYNEKATALMTSKPNVHIVDLNSAVNSICGKNYTTCNLQRYQNVHFTTAGKQFCAIQVAHTVAPLLAPKWLQLNVTRE